MQKLLVLCVGRCKEPFYIDACTEYAKRLSRFCRLEVTELPESRLPARPSAAQIQSALSHEAEAVRARFPANPLLTALCVEGEPLSSEALAARLARWEQDPRQPVFLIGGSFGLHGSLKSAADLRLSMSAMTFPHHLARVMLLEQLYRAFQINAGGPYHK